ncbi:helix-turn-helix domain-containing protein [Aquimarina sp. AU474]|uniref:helix-turn-helix domain-containing protein n=1 Tax=Aquimarina sp. AU474 TaxID=2108529 RepID=UPI000D68DD2F|nr:helix-turn-helix domain-containing protein [Aquimarina sp. AU474]
MVNKKLKKLLRKSKGAKTVYGISKALGVSPQAGDYVVKRKNLVKDFERLQKIADYMGVEIKDILDHKEQ